MDLDRTSFIHLCIHDYVISVMGGVSWLINGEKKDCTRTKSEERVTGSFFRHFIDLISSVAACHENKWKKFVARCILHVYVMFSM